MVADGSEPGTRMPSNSNSSLTAAADCFTILCARIESNVGDLMLVEVPLARDRYQRKS